jgi:hypothetical protein
LTIEVGQLRYTVVTADTLSFSDAAATLNVKQSTQSRKAMQNEHRLACNSSEETPEALMAGHSLAGLCRQLVGRPSAQNTMLIHPRLHGKSGISLTSTRRPGHLILNSAPLEKNGE